MMIKQAAATIKNVTDWRGDIGKVTLFTGANRSGKTALLEAIRLALTNTCSVGATPAKQALLADGEASALVTGDNLSAKWTIKSGKRTWNLEYDGMKVQSITGDAPLTVDEFWSLTGEQRWGLVESIVGTFSEEPPASADPARAELRALKSQVPPPAYDGPALAELERLREHYKSVIDAARKAKQEIQSRQMGIDADKSSLENAIKIRDVIAGNLERFEQAVANRLPQEVELTLSVWEQDPSNILSGGSLAEAITAISERLNKEIGALDKLADDDELMFATSQLEIAAEHLASLAEDETYQLTLIESGDRFSKRLREIGDEAGLPFSHDSVSTLHAAKQRASRFGVDLAAQITRCKDLLARSQSGIEKIQVRIAANEATEVPSMGDAVEAAGQLETIESQLAHARSTADWLAAADKRADRIAELEQTIKDLDNENAAFAKRRADYLSDAADMISAKANEILLAMNFPLMGIRIETTGKRGTLTAVSDGVDIQAMAGSEKLLYGVALVNALHELGKSKLPVLFVEAAELNGENLTKLLGALAKYRTKGNVIVSHWYGVCVNGVVTHSFGV